MDAILSLQDLSVAARQRRRCRPTRAERGNQFPQFLLPLTSGRYLGAGPGYRLSQSVRIVKRTVLFHHETHTHFTELHSPMMCATWRQCRGQIVWSSVVIFLLISDNGDFRLVRSAFGRELGLRRHLLTLVRRRVAVAVPTPLSP